MSFSFKTILIPIDFSINSEVAVNRALELADPTAHIHLVHVLNDFAHLKFIKGRKSLPHKITDPAEASATLYEWKHLIKEILPDAQVSTWVIAGESIQHTINKKAREVNTDLVVISKTSHHSWLPFFTTLSETEVAEKANTAILTVKPGSLHKKIRTIVVPVDDEMPEHKTEIIASLCRKAKIKVYLVTFMPGANTLQNSSASSLLQTYQWLKNVLHCHVEYSVLQGYNKAKALLAYAEKIEADILLLNPKSETKIGWPNRHISDALPSQSKVQVLMVQPY